MNVAPFAVSLGDPSGIGPEILAKAWAVRQEAGLPPFFAVGHQSAIAAVWDGPVARITDPAEAGERFGDALPLLAVADAIGAEPGRPTLDGARLAFQSLETATGLVRSGRAGALVTAPISKGQLYQVGFPFPGQTEFVAERCGVSRSNAIMMLAGPTLRVVPMTTHVALAEVPGLLTRQLILNSARATERGLQRNFGIERPRLVVAGLNPHAGEGGAMGSEEAEIIAPAVEELRAQGLDIRGPLPADTLFHAEARAGYDAALCPTHDQALIPLKTLHFDEGVNITLGLPIVRTSPDHGTAFAIAGQNRARPQSMIAAIRMAGEAVRHRQAGHHPLK